MTVISRLFGYFEEGFLNLLITLMTLLVFGEVIARFFSIPVSYGSKNSP